MKRAALLDVNLLIALFNPDHIHHDLAHDWFADARAGGWATCPLTEQGVVRILSNPKYWPGAGRSVEILNRLRHFCDSGEHEFWPDGLSLRDGAVFDLGLAAGHRQITDAYLLGLAVANRGRLATFDRSIPIAAVRGASADTLLVISETPD